MGSVSQRPDIDTVHEFITDWPKLQVYYKKIAKKASEICSINALEEAGIRGFSTFRAKGKASLEAKLIARQKDGKQYNSVKDIYKDIHDLAGVRIVLYFPPQRPLVENFIRRRFNVCETKRFPEQQNPDKVDDAFDTNNREKTGQGHVNPSSQTSVNPILQHDRSILSDGYCRKFPGYCADHYRVSLKPEDYPEKDHEEQDQGKVEIQVVSIFRHAWAEVQHDTVYKGMDLNSGVYQQILDGLSGVVSLGETFLSQLFDNKEHNAVFETHHDLALYLNEFMRVMADRRNENLGDVELLWQLLNVMDLNRTNTLRDTLKVMDFSLESEPYSDVARLYQPFNVSLGIYIQDHIVHSPAAKAKTAELLENARKAGNDDEKQHKLRAIVDSFAWFGRVRMTSDWVHQVMHTAEPAPSRPLLDIIRYLDTQGSKRFYTAKLRQDEVDLGIDEVIDTLWQHLYHHEKRLVQFVFNLSRLGVRSCAPDWDHVGTAIKALRNNNVSPLSCI
ncbi:hypothetical protein FE257_010354 [Aspergillus nanangensis]|uniref:RelA/SpoT domain-containing protein n=1 Tax=Aspergillus nanangensis TaxID=2582783 RepID=A0AAD4CIV1_ASPNN|nr:hypothetical protein FE257_010354 [Aspergillus nanangensis]